MEFKLNGLIAAPYTPFHTNGSLNLDIIPSYADFLKNRGVKGAFVCGTTGEGMLLSIEERKKVSESWMRHQSADFKIIVHVGACSPVDAAHLAVHASEIGADAISAMGPVFLASQDLNDLVLYCKTVTSACEHLPFFYYHIPSVSGLNQSMYDFLKVASSEVPSFCGIKYTHNDLMDMQLCLRADGGKWSILHGQDQSLLAGLSFGVQGAVGSTYNYLSPLFDLIMKAHANGQADEAAELQHKAVRFIYYLSKYGGGVSGGKPLMSLVGLDCGKLRNPAFNMSESDHKSFLQHIEDEGIMPYIRA